MSIFMLSWKFFTRRSKSNKLNITSFLPMTGVAFGTVTILLTFAIMDGLEHDIFDTLKSFSGGSIININDISSKDNDVVIKYLESNNLNYSKFIERKAILQMEDRSRIVNMRAFDNLNLILNKITKNLEYNYNNKSLIIGEELSNRLNISLQDSVKILSPLDLKFSTTFIPQEILYVDNIFSTRLLDFDLNFIFLPYSIGEKLFKKSGNVGYFLINDVEIPKLISNIKGIKIEKWDEIHKSLVGAMKLEKIAYVGFGFLLILISCFSLLSTMSISVMQKISQIGILKAVGYNNFNIKKIFFYFSCISGVIGVIVGIFIAYIIKIIEINYPFFHLLFGDYPFLEFPIQFNLYKIFIVSCCSIFAIIIASIYPASKASKFDPIISIGMK